MDQQINQSLKEAFYLVYGNKNFKYTPLRFNYTESKFIGFLKENTDISIKECVQDNQNYYLITDIKFTPRTGIKSIDIYTLLTLIYLNFENCAAFGQIRRGDAGFFSSSAIERYFEYFKTKDSQLKIIGEMCYNLGVFKCTTLPELSVDNDTTVAKLHEIVQNTFDTKSMTCTYTFDASSIIRHDFGELTAKSIKFTFTVNDRINSRTGSISRIYYNSFKNIIEDNFNNKLINDSCSPDLTHCVTVENIALFIANKIKSIGFNCTSTLSVSMDNEKASLIA